MGRSYWRTKRSASTRSLKIPEADMLKVAADRGLSKLRIYTTRFGLENIPRGRF